MCACRALALLANMCVCIVGVVQTVALVLKVGVSHASTAIRLRVQAGPRFVWTVSSEVPRGTPRQWRKEKSQTKRKTRCSQGSNLLAKIQL